MDDAKQQLLEKLKAANNILVTVSRNPSVDQLSALLGLTLLLNKQGKHAAAVFSGQVPSTIEFLQPEETFEKDTNSLRDFIIALDKNKADKLRYKVEDNVVRIFITPYKTSLGQEDFDFSQGDFNIDLVVAIGVQQQEDLDEAITAHGRILHDATVATVNVSGEADLGTINWKSPYASSLSELATDLAEGLAAELVDEQIATALLTGIVAETERFSNDKTSANTMSLSAALMAAGANQQLVASKLAEPLIVPDMQQADASELKIEKDTPDSSEVAELPVSNDGTIEISHNDEVEIENEGEGDSTTEDQPALELPAPDDSTQDTVSADSDETTPASSITSMSPGSKMITEAPTLGGTLTANSGQGTGEPNVDTYGVSSSEESPQLLEHNVFTPTSTDDPADSESQDNSDTPEPELPEAPVEPEPIEVPAPESEVQPEPTLPEVPPEVFEPPTPPEQVVAEPPAFTPAPPTWTPPVDDPFNLIPDGDGQPTSDPSLAELEHSIKQDEPAQVADHLDTARDEVSRALTSADATSNPEPIQALNAQPLGDDLRSDQPAPTPAPVQEEDSETVVIHPETPVTDDSQVVDPNAPPPVPPPIPFQFGNNPPQ